jgi:hypothetical protein
MRRKLAHVSTRSIHNLDRDARTQQNAGAMAYVVHFLQLAPGEDWLDALESQERAQQQRSEREGERLADIVRPDWWRITALAKRLFGEAELRRTRRGLTIVDRESGLVLELEQDEIALALPYRLDKDLARETLALARRIASFVEDETGLVAFDPQLGQPFLGVEGALEEGARFIASTQRALVRVVGGQRGRPRDEPRPYVR